MEGERHWASHAVLNTSEGCNTASSVLPWLNLLARNSCHDVYSFGSSSQAPSRAIQVQRALLPPT